MLSSKEEKGKEQTFGQVVRIINSVKSTTNGEKDPYVLKAMERAKVRLRSRLSELNEG